jgi:hypothetical protein
MPSPARGAAPTLTEVIRQAVADGAGPEDVPGEDRSIGAKEKPNTLKAAVSSSRALGSAWPQT